MAPSKTMDDFWIEQGWVEYDRHGWRLTRARWEESDAVQRRAIQFLVEQVLDKDPRDVTVKDFNDNRLSGLFSRHFSSRPYEAIRFAFPKLNIQPWEMKRGPTGLFDDRKTRIQAIQWLVKKLNKNPKEMMLKDFRSHRLGGLLSDYYSNSPYRAIAEAFPNRNIKPWEMMTSPMGSFHESSARKAAIKWLIKQTDKKPKDLSIDDFLSHGLNALAKRGIHNVILEVFPKINPRELKQSPEHFYDDRDHRIEAIRWLVRKTKKDPRDLTGSDFDEYRLGILRNYYEGSTYKAVAEAFPHIHPWEMKTTPRLFFSEKKNRIAAVKWLVKKTNKDPQELTKEDFTSHRLGGLLSKHYTSSPYKAITEAFPKFRIQHRKMAKRKHRVGKRRVAD